MQQPKVYCRDCKHYISGDILSYSICNPRKNIVHTHYGTYFETYNPSFKNDNNDCKDYKFSWFWSKLRRFFC